MIHLNHPMPKQYGHPPVPAVHQPQPMPRQAKKEHKPLMPVAPLPNGKALFTALNTEDQNKQQSWLI